MNPGLIYARYRISINGSYLNEHRKVRLNQAQIDNFDFQVGTIFDQIVKRKTGQIILEGIGPTMPVGSP